MLILKNIKFVSFSAGASPRPTKFVRILGEGTYFVGVGAHDDPEKTINYRNIMVEPAMCAKNFSLEVFWRYLFFKKGSKTKQSYTTAQTPSALCALKLSCMKVFGATFFQKGSKIQTTAESDQMVTLGGNVIRYDLNIILWQGFC